jgi:hypothetical protein
MNRLFLLIIILLGVALNACKNSKETTKPAATESSSSVSPGGRKMDSFTYLKKCMQGNFSSLEQSQHDSDYFDIRLRMVPIWKSAPDHFYLYVEQAMSTALDRPYRIRIYRVVKNDDENFTSYIYKLNDPRRFIGKKENDEVFNTITADSLLLLEGCEVRLKFDASRWEFNGSTGQKTCPSERSGASWATSTVTLNDERMISWDQGWDSQGKQVWGAVKGGYIFKKSE